MSIRNNLLKPRKLHEELFELEDFPDESGAPTQVLIRCMTLKDQLYMDKTYGGDNVGRAVAMIPRCVLDPETKERVFSDEDIAALEGAQTVPLQRLIERVGAINSKASEDAEKN